MKVKVRELIEKLSQFDGDYPVYVISTEDDRDWFEEANKAEFDTDGIYITYDKKLAEKESKRLNLYKDRSELIARLEKNNEDCLSLCILTDLEEMEDLIKDSKKIKADIKKIEKELGWE